MSADDPAGSAPPGHERLPAHRIALRAALTAVVGGGAATAALYALALPLDVLRPRNAEVEVFMALGVFGALGALLVGAEQMALRARPRLRPLALLAVLLAAPSVGLGAAVWVQGLLREGTAGGYAALEAFASRLAREPRLLAGLSLALLLPLVGLGAARLLALRARRRVVIALGTGWLGFIALVTCLDRVLGRSGALMLLWTVVPAAGELASPLALRLEGALLARLRREPPPPPPPLAPPPSP